MITTFNFETKDVSDEGHFVGLASTYGPPADMVGDIVEVGAFRKTLAQSAERPLLWMHSSPIGLVKLRDTPQGLEAEGKLSLGVQQARDALVLLKDKVIKALSIGFSVVRDRPDGAIRRLEELKLWEVSLVVVPANPEARITQVKNLDEARRAIDLFRSDVLRAIGGQ